MAVRFSNFGYLYLPNSQKWNSTVCCWVRMPDVWADRGVLSFGSAGTYGTSCVLQDLANNVETVRIFQDAVLGGFASYGLGYYQTGKWYFIALVVSNTGEATYYIGMANRKGLLRKFRPFQSPDENGAVYIGAMGGGNYSTDGMAACWVKRWTVAKTQEELLLEMEGPAVVDPVGLWSSCPLANSASLQDTSGNGNHMLSTGDLDTVADVVPEVGWNAPTLTPNLRVFCLGDSRTFGTNGGGITYPGVLQTLRPGDESYVFAQNGAGTMGCYLWLRDDVLPLKSETRSNVLSLFIGVNELIAGLTSDQVLGNSLSVVELALENDIVPVLCSETSSGDWGAEQLDMINQTDALVAGQVAPFSYCRLADVPGLMDPNSVLYSGDQLHPNGDGYTVIAGEVNDALFSLQTVEFTATGVLGGIAASGAIYLESMSLLGAGVFGGVRASGNIRLEQAAAATTQAVSLDKFVAGRTLAVEANQLLALPQACKSVTALTGDFVLVNAQGNAVSDALTSLAVVPRNLVIRSGSAGVFLLRY